MSETRNDPERLDLRALAPTDAQAERVIGRVMDRLATRPGNVAPPGSDVLEIVGRYLSPRWIAAAAALLTAGSIAVVASRRESVEGASIDTTVAMWATQQHVPTNGELLAAFQGYQR